MTWRSPLRDRRSRKGNRQINAGLHRIAITQMRLGGAGQAYVEHRRMAGDSKKEAIRALRRRISDEVCRRMRTMSAFGRPRRQPSRVMAA